MSGLALKIFLGFWLLTATLLGVFALLPDRGTDVRLQDHVRQYGLLATSMLADEGGARACQRFAALVERQGRLQFALFDAGGRALCVSSPAAAGALPTYLEWAPGTILGGRDDGRVAVVTLPGDNGARYRAAGRAQPGFDAIRLSPAFPYRNFTLAILISGLACFILARYLAAPLRHVRDTSRRLAAGDLEARVGPSAGRRNDEVGEVVRDFDMMAGRLQALVHAQSQLLSDMSHELRSPLARLNVALELARRKAAPAAQPDLDRIVLEADRMNDLIGRILALARAESGAGRSETDVDLAGVLRHVTDDARYEAERQHKSVTLEAERLPPVPGDPELLASAIDNVVRNAVRYTREGTTVEVGARPDAGDVVVEVRDHGPGVAPGELERIFTPFHRSEPARNRATGGVGLGLAIARRAIDLHHGTIAAANAGNGGLVVTIRLPAGAPAPRHG
ncbi:MAG: sensor histidine kinase [Vicinamibacterales bacterium]